MKLRNIYIQFLPVRLIIQYLDIEILPMHIMLYIERTEN